MKKLLAAAALLWAGGVIQSFTYLAVWSHCSGLWPHAHTYQLVLLWPWYRLIDVIAYCA